MTTLAHANADVSRGRSPSIVLRYLPEMSVAGAYAVLLGLLAWLHPEFFRPDLGQSQSRFFSACVNMAPILIAGVGMMIVIVARHIDISIGSQLSVCAVLAGLMAQMHWPMPVVAIATIAIGGAMGAINGVLVAGLGLPSIVATLATMEIFAESLRWARQGQFISNLPAGFQWFGLTQSAGQWVLIIAALIVFGGFFVAMRWIAAGRMVYAVGSDLEAARLAGIRPRRVVFAVFVLMGALVGLAALLNAVRSPDVDPGMGNGWELTVIAAVVVGGAAITGGRGTLVGTLIGVALLATIGPAQAFFHVQSQWDKAVRGLIILGAVASDGILRRRN